MSRYDTRTTIFSREGRLYQVEYAIEAISKAAPAVGIVTSEGIVLVAEKRAGSALLDVRNATEKIHLIDSHIVCAVAGITSDANTLIEHARVNSQRHLYTYQQNASVESIVENLCSLKQSYTQFGGLRPFGVSFLLAGWDEHQGYQLYQTDPSGNYSGWKARSIGSSAAEGLAVFKEEIKEDQNIETIQEALEIAIRVIAKTMSANTLECTQIEAAVFRKNGDQMVFSVLSEAELKPTLEKSMKVLDDKAKKEAGDA